MTESAGRAEFPEHAASSPGGGPSPEEFARLLVDEPALEPSAASEVPLVGEARSQAGGRGTGSEAGAPLANSGDGAPLPLNGEAAAAALSSADVSDPVA